MIIKALDNLRQKPPHVRQRFAFGIAFGMTTMIALVWFVTLPARFVFDREDIVVADNNVNTAPFASMIHQIKEQFGSIKNQAATITASSSESGTTSTSTFDATSILASTSNQYIPAAAPSIPVLIGTTSATTSE